MTDIKRYSPALMGEDEQYRPVYAELKESDNGEYVLHSDYKALIDELAALDQISDVRHDADIRTIEMWKEKTGMELCMPGQTDMCIFLLEELDKHRKAIKAAQGLSLFIKLNDYPEYMSNAFHEMVRLADVQDTALRSLAITPPPEETP